MVHMNIASSRLQHRWKLIVSIFDREEPLATQIAPQNCYQRCDIEGNT